MGDSVFINGRAAVHKGSTGKSIAFPDVCLCPPSPPAGPIPTPLPNTVQAADLDGGAKSVLIEGNPSGKQSSFFKKSTGNEVSRPTGGGVITHGVQGKAYFQTFSMNVMFEGEPAVRHMDLLTHNHLGPQPGNTPPMPWLATMKIPPVAPKTSTKKLAEGKESLAFACLDAYGDPVPYASFVLKSPKGQTVAGRLLSAGTFTALGLAKGSCELTFPECDALPALEKPGRSGAAQIYRPRAPLRLPTGNRYVIELPILPSFWLDLGNVRKTATARRGAFVLRSGDGKYQMARSPVRDAVRVEGKLTLEFPRLLRDLRYSLVYEPSPGKVGSVLFEDQPYEELVPKAVQKRKVTSTKGARAPAADVAVDERALRVHEKRLGSHPVTLARDLDDKA